MEWLALVMVIGQGLTAFALFKAVKTLGQFTEASVAAHKSNMLVHRRLECALQEIGDVRRMAKLDSELAADRAANFVQYDPPSDREKIA